MDWMLGILYVSLHLNPVTSACIYALYTRIIVGTVLCLWGPTQPSGFIYIRIVYPCVCMCMFSGRL